MNKYYLRRTFEDILPVCL